MRKSFSLHNTKYVGIRRNSVFLAKVSLEKFGATTSYAHSFFILSTWNLIARAITVAVMKYDFIHMDNDMIVVLPPRSKTDQAGFCPVLALARHVVIDGNRTRYRTDFFTTHDDDYDRFGEDFSDVVHSERTREFLGVSANKLGKHSGCKAGATYCSSFLAGQGVM